MMCISMKSSSGMRMQRIWISHLDIVQMQRGIKKSLVVPQIYVNHLASKEWRTPSYEATLYAIANRRYLSYKIYPTQFWKRWFLSWSDWCYEKFICRDLTEKQNWHKVRQLCRQKDKCLKEGRIEDVYS